MIKIFYGNDRVKAREMAERILGKDCEIFEGENLTAADLDSLFLGMSIFAEKRNILVKNLSENAELWEKVPKYLETSHNVVLFEPTFNRTKKVNKELVASKKIEVKEFKLPEKIDNFAAFRIFDLAYDGKIDAALQECEKVQSESDPFLLLGAFASSAMKKLNGRNAKAVKVVKILAKADVDMKTTGFEPWDLLKVALMNIANL